MPGGPKDLNSASDFDIDKMIKEIDAEIARLEAEEKKEAEKKDNDKNVETLQTPKVEEKEEEKLDNILSGPSLSQSQPAEQTNTHDSSNKEPNIEKVVHSNMVDLHTFELKDDEKKNEENKNSDVVVNENKKDQILSDKDDYDDFFDDFFFEE